MRERKKIKRRKWPWVLLIIVVVVATSMTALWLKCGTMIKTSVADGYAYSRRLDKNDFYPKNSTIIYAADGSELKRFSQSDADYTKESEINPMIRKGLVDVEDSRFYIHHGVDTYGIMRSIVSRPFDDRIQGGSTLTQQLVKNVVLKDQSQTMPRKIKEMVIAQEIEKKFSKSQILEFYINDVYMGHTTYGFTSAANYYFSKNQSDLSLDQVAMLIGIPNNPVYYDPVVYPERTVKRRNMVLNIMNKQGLITTKQYQAARKQPLGLQLNKHNFDNDISKNYAINYAVYNATEEIMKSAGFKMQYQFTTDDEMKKYNQAYGLAFDKAQGQLLNGGYSIRTSIDPNVQSKIEEIVDQQFQKDNTRDQHGKLQPQVASTVVDNKTGEVIAIVGGRGTENDQVNRAVTGYRQPGSTAKPLTAYAPAFERGYLPQSKVTDSPVGSIKNWYSGYRGSTTLRGALENSINTVAFKLAMDDKDKTYYDDLSKMEFARLAPQDSNPIVAIGGFTNGTTTTEMASAYSSFSRSGEFIHPTNVRSVYDESNERMIYQNRHLTKKVYSANASYMTLNIMQSVITDGLGKSAKLDNYKYTAGKTGTTDNYKDSYFVGMTPDFTIANWTGNDLGQPLVGTQQNLPISTFKAEGQYLVDQLQQKDVDFEKPSTIKVKGKNLYVDNSQKKPSVQDMIDEQFNLFNQQQEQANKDRLFNMDYRIIYHLSKKEEYRREDKVKDALDKYDKTPITKESEYQTRLDDLQQIRYLNNNVKRQKAKTKFAKQILQLERDLNVQQASFEAEKNSGQLAKYNTERRRIEADRAERRQEMLDKLMPEYRNQLAKVKDAYRNNDPDKETQKQTLIDLMNEIRSYGGDVPDLDINLDE